MTTEHTTLELRALVEGVERHHHHQSPREVVARGLALRVDPGVFDPSRSNVGDLLAEFMPVEVGSRVLDLGTGTGFIALVAAQRGAATVVASDRQPLAAVCARHNIARHGLSERIEVRLGDLFEGLRPDERFDTITFNFPFVPWEPRTPWQRDNFDPGHALLRRFIAGVGARLDRGGRVAMTWADIGDTALLHALARAHRFSCTTLAERRHLGSVHSVFLLSPDQPT